MFVNVHLEGNPSKAQVRIRQLEKQFRRLQSRHGAKPGMVRMIVAGDFNAQLRNATGVFARQGRIDSKGKKAFDGKTVIRTESRHDWRLKSALRADCPTPTYMGWRACGDVSTARKRRPIDHILYCSRTLDLKEIRYPMTLDTSLLKEFIASGGLPNSTFPSDHVPVAAVLTYRRIDLSSPPPPKKNVKEEYLSETQRETLRRLIQSIPKWKASGRPSTEWIQMTKAHHKRVRYLMFFYFSLKTHFKHNTDQELRGET